MIPTQASGQSFEAHQAEMAVWLGCDVDTMNSLHDPLHVALCRWLGVESYAMREAGGAKLGHWEACLASLEEEAVLCVQRFMQHAGGRIPE